MGCYADPHNIPSLKAALTARPANCGHRRTENEGPFLQSDTFPQPVEWHALALTFHY